MSSETFVSESRVSGNQANIPAPIRRALDIDDGDLVRWIHEEDTVRIEIVREREGTFADFEGYEGEPTDAAAERDGWGIE
jgi:bifunctional DNA-binding transcriptional regulator/antitoxin component of YhaV-PrlF toxin-antitoxin module